jgi:hypothetical protein
VIIGYNLKPSSNAKCFSPSDLDVYLIHRQYHTLQKAVTERDSGSFSSPIRCSSISYADSSIASCQRQQFSHYQAGCCGDAEAIQATCLQHLWGVIILLNVSDNNNDVFLADFKTSASRRTFACRAVSFSCLVVESNVA